MLKKYNYLLILLVIPAIVTVVYYPGLSGSFVLDDFSNILQVPAIAMHELSWDSLKNTALSMDRRPLARASFGLNYYFTGFQPYYFKIVNVAIHCINAILLFSIILKLLKQHTQAHNIYNLELRLLLIALTATLGWALHPINLTSVLYVVQRMNGLSALFVLAGMLTYIIGRSALDEYPLKAWLLMAASILLFLPLAWFSKENGALLPLFLFVLELTIFKFRTSDSKQTRMLYLFHIIVVLLPSLLAIAYIVHIFDVIDAGYGNRHFNMLERILTEPRILWMYIRMILLPAPALFGLFLDDISVSHSLLDPFSTLPALLGVFGLLLLALFTVRKASILAFGVLFFLSGHVMESTLIPLELAYEHRNYLPSIGLLLPVFYYLGTAGYAEKYKTGRVAIISVLIFLFALLTHSRAMQWSDNINLYLKEVEHHPQSVRANYEAGKIYGQMLERGQGDREKNYRLAITHFNKVTALRNNTTSGLFGSILSSIDSGHRINPLWIDELAHRLGEQPLEQVNILWLDKLTDCVSIGKCNKEQMQLPRLINAAIGYVNANNKNKSLLYAVLAKYYYKVEKNTVETIKMARKAVSLQPSNLYHQLNLVKYLINSGNFSEAQKALEVLQKVDTYGQHRAETSRLMNFIKNKQLQ